MLKAEVLEEQLRSSQVSEQSLRNVISNNRSLSFRIIALPFFTGYTCERCQEQEIGIERLISKETQNLACFRGAGSRVPESDPPADGLLSILFARVSTFMTPEAVPRLGAIWDAATNKVSLRSILCCIVKKLEQNFDGYREIYDRMRMVEPKAEGDILCRFRRVPHGLRVRCSLLSLQGYRPMPQAG